jgi:hypothetical protein
MDVYQRRRLVALSAIAVVFIVLVLLIRSCGGEDEPTTASPLAGATGAGGATVLAQDDYISQADAICLEANTSLADVDQSDPNAAASDEAEIVTGELQQLQSLPPPDGGTNKLDKFLSALDKQVAAYQDRSTAVDRGDDATVAEIDATIDDAQADAATAADKFGFKVCGDTSKTGDSSSSGESDTTTTTDTGGTVVPTTPVTPTTTTPVVPETPAPSDGGGATPDAPSDGGTGTGDSGGVSP